MAYHYEQMEDSTLEELILKRVLDRVDTVMKAQPFYCSVMTQRICGLSSLLSLSPRIGRFVGSNVESEVPMIQGITGVVAQQLLSLSPVFEAAGFSIPAAGTEMPRQGLVVASSASGSFAQQLMALKNFPLCVFRPKRGDETEKVILAARQAMKVARTAGVTWRAVAPSPFRQLYSRPSLISYLPSSNQEYVGPGRSSKGSPRLGGSNNHKTTTRACSRSKTTGDWRSIFHSTREIWALQSLQTDSSKRACAQSYFVHSEQWILLRVQMRTGMLGSTNFQPRVRLQISC